MKRIPSGALTQINGGRNAGASPVALHGEGGVSLAAEDRPGDGRIAPHGVDRAGLLKIVASSHQPDRGHFVGR